MLLRAAVHLGRARRRDRRRRGTDHLERARRRAHHQRCLDAGGAGIEGQDHPDRGPDVRSFVRSQHVRSFSTRRARTTTGPPPDGEDTPSRSFVRSFSTRRARTTPGPLPTEKTHPQRAERWPGSRARGRTLGSIPDSIEGFLGFRLGRSPYLGALEYHVAAAAPTVTHPLPHLCTRIVLSLIHI